MLSLSRFFGISQGGLKIYMKNQNHPQKRWFALRACIHKRKYCRIDACKKKRQSYQTDLTSEQWKKIEPLFSNCKVPWYNGMEINIEEKKKLWDKYYMEAPEQQRQPVEQYKIVKRA
jgi:hypothetical protein